MMSVLSACVAACINPLTLPTRRSMYLTLEYKYTVFPFPLFLGDVSAGPDYFKRLFFLVPILVSNTPGLILVVMAVKTFTSICIISLCTPS